MRGAAFGIAVGASVAIATLPCDAQTFAQVTNLGGSLGPRITRTIAVDRTDRALFYTPTGGTGFRALDGTRFGFTADSKWQRIMYSREGDWLRSFDNAGGVGGALHFPTDIDVAASGYLFVTDLLDGRVLVGQFSDPYIYPVGAFSAAGSAPVAVAWDGVTSPFSSLNAYILNSGGSVEYWTNASGSTWTLSWRYGSQGSGTGQLFAPSAVCAGRTSASGSGASHFTTHFYVADAGNRRMVWLQRTGSGAIWKGERTLPDAGRPRDCATDHFGNVYVADDLNSRIIKYTWNLNEITRYGTYGTGESNLNTFARPATTHVLFGVKTVGGQSVWYGEGRIVTAEEWGVASGGVEHVLGIEVPQSWAQPSAWGPTAWFYLTDHSNVMVEVLTDLGAHVATVLNSLSTPTWHSVLWNGYTDGGQAAPIGDYKFRITATSAYGCQGQAWCQTTKMTNLVYWDGPSSGCTCDEPGEYCVPCEANVALLPDGLEISPGLPRRYRLGQVITRYSGPLLRIEGTGGASVARSAMTDAQAVGSVRTQGITALHIDVPDVGAKRRVTIRIYSLTGRLVRVLVDETLDAGSYVVGWDGTDAQGREVLPGVYLAHMTAGDYRGVQRLILR